MEIWLNFVIYDILLLIGSTKMPNLVLFADPEPPFIVPMVPLERVGITFEPISLHYICHK